MERRIITKTGESKVEVKKSKFLGIAANISSEEEAAELLKEIRKKHSMARHVCYAYSIGDSNPRMKFSDDGEPGGTAGKPILDVITGSGIQDIIVIVVRYFGGILLGTGGLVRAYTDSAKEAVLNAETKEECLCCQYDMEIEYPDFETVKYLLENVEGVSMNMDYGTGVTMHVVIPEKISEDVTKKVSDKTSGRAKINLTGKGMM